MTDYKPALTMEDFWVSFMGRNGYYLEGQIEVDGKIVEAIFDTTYEGDTIFVAMGIPNSNAVLSNRNGQLFVNPLYDRNRELTGIDIHSPISPDHVWSKVHSRVEAIRDATDPGAIEQIAAGIDDVDTLGGKPGRDVHVINGKIVKVTTKGASE